ncbi:outer membrane receptor protein involved in Fe transport [Gelidibacter algens]|uniref:Outer membrane receptor protein involved in Fe transport n=1 Tax=Gelidibacter algens TaxID=49280 RepID=A0A1A7R703_9FLAO|nr:outer membrane beta-barrel family protein [Gelidibacter algens]OBX27283.1 TonB-dependent receptor [Gelidibacter algens]RAJ20930.1 outer membrane receptor protein involved in Fe transport [Gelidibacter algens]
MKSILLLCILMCSTLYAQPSATHELKEGSISGTIIDANLNEPLPYVTIVIKNSSNETITGAITQDDGTFKIAKLPEGKLTATIQYIGYKTVAQPFQIGEDTYNVDLGNILLEEDIASLDEVTVVAEVSTIQQKVDRKVITVGKDLTTAGATASDIMNNIPSVSIDQQTGNLSLRGNENVRVMVDGKLSNVPVDQLLKQIPSTSIKQIELITNPSAKYNPEGMSGIINIILHKNTNIGFNGNLNVGLTKEINARFNSSIDLNYRNGKFNLYGNYGNNIGNSTNYGTIERPDDNSQQIFNFFNNNKSHLYKFGIDFYADDNNTISVFTNQNTYDGTGIGTTSILAPNTADRGQVFNTVSDNISSQYNVVYKHNFKKEGEKIDLEVDYNAFDQGEISGFNSFNIPFPPNYIDFVNTKRDQTTINIDYVNPLSEKAKLEVGLEARLFNTDVNYDSTGQSFDATGLIVDTPSTDFNYQRDIYSAYATYGKTFEKWSYQVGARAEAVTDDAKAISISESSSETTPFKNEYFQVYPSAFLTYTPNEKNSYQASVSRRVDRPGLQQVNPIREWSTPLISSFGNTELQPQFTNSVEVNYTRKLEKGSITGGVFYRMIEDEINQAVFIDRLDLNKVILTYDNFDNTSAYGIELSSNYKPTKWWNFNASADLFAQTQKGISEVLNTPLGQEPTINDIALTEIKVNNVAYNFRMNNTFKATKNLTLSVFGMYRSEQEGLQFTNKPMYFVNTGLRYSFLDDAATFSFNYNDIFNTMKARFESNRPYPQIGQFNWESNTWSIGLSYRFGGGKYSALQRKNRDDNEKSGSGGFM